VSEGYLTTIAISESDEAKAFKVFNQDGFDSELFDRIKKDTLKRIPKLNLFEVWGLNAQNIEGAILIKVML
jgi:hypothetical protein